MRGAGEREDGAPTFGGAVAVQLQDKGEAAVPDPPWRTAAAPGRNEVTVIRQCRLDAPVTRAESVAQHLASLPVWGAQTALGDGYTERPPQRPIPPRRPH